MPIHTIQPGDIAARRCRGESFYLLDVRTPAEFTEIHADGAVNLPLGDLSKRAPLPEACSGQLCLLCKSGARAREAARILAERDENLVLWVVDGGNERWLASGLPVVRGPQLGWSIERQVRLVAGCLVFVGVLLNRLGLDPAVYLAGLVGLGLTIAALTDTCAMGVFLAQMPWNRRKV